MPKKPQDRKAIIVPDPSKKTHIDEQGRKYWFATGFYGRSIKTYGEPWKFRTSVWDVIGLTLFIGLIALAIYYAIFGK